ncbi:hypothetical protein [Paenarthrobacter sp. NPDC018779]|uniref:hypothetical protein n=1 Tax=Paenarthrobacter sp. NPDC018779 TaxID=3364375 RepID=UPI0037C60A94
MDNNNRNHKERGGCRDSLVACTGSPCPANGWWQPREPLAEATFVFEGTIMPSHHDASTEWTLVEDADRL